MKDLHTWLAIAVLVLASTVGDVFTSRAMKTIGDVGKVYRAEGLKSVLRKVVMNHRLWLGVAFMAVAFFSLLFALSWNDVSLVAPAAASLQFISNAVAGKFILHERVGHRRWIAAVFVAFGVALAAV